MEQRSPEPALAAAAAAAGTSALAAQSCLFKFEENIFPTLSSSLV